MSKPLVGHKWMTLALACAKQRRGMCSPNPSVGAVIVSVSGELIASGCHYAAGHDHAEVDALKKAGAAARGATLFVTLEPCSHTGKTPPCTQAIIDAGVARVFYGYSDPNPTAEGGACVLTQADIACQKIDSAAVDEFYKSYAHWLKTGMPRLIAKLAQTADGKTAQACGSPLKITGPEAAELTAQGRHDADAILTTVSTVIADNPRLNSRLTDCVVAKPVYVLDRLMRLPESIRLLDTAAELVLLVSSAERVDKSKWPVNTLRYLPIEVIDGRLSWRSIAKTLGAEGFHEVWVESGPTAFQSLLQSGLMSKALIMQSAQAVGEGMPGISLSHEQLVDVVFDEQRLGADSLFIFEWPP